MKKNSIHWRLLTVLFLLLALLLLPGAMMSGMGSAFGEEAFSVKRVGNIVPFTENAFVITAPSAGRVCIRIHDPYTTYRTLETEVEKGETRLDWDGCGYNRERLSPKSYTITATLETEDGRNFTVSYQSPVEYTGQALQYALPSGERASLERPEDWFLEYKTMMKGTVVAELAPEEGGEVLYTWTVNTVGGRIYRKTLADLAGSRLPEAGNYSVRVWEQSRTAEVFSFPLRMTERADEVEEIFLTGEILPERGMSDGEIWAMMMQPSVVVDIDFFSHQSVYAKPEEGSASLGTLHGQTQAVKVIRLEGDWAFIGAWNHEEGAYVEGWVPRGRLKVEKPREEYGLLIDKKAQTLTVYRRGQRLDTLLVSTGRPEQRELEQETAAGSFLTGYHRVDFSMNGSKYDYVIQYDGGNLLHQLPYAWGTGKKDFSRGRSYLGAKASHACIRIQSEPGEGGVNAYWLWTHLPYHTRVMILDDPEEREGEAQRLKRTEKGEGAEPPELETAEEYGSQPVLTFGGSLPRFGEGKDTWIEDFGGEQVGFALCGEEEYIAEPISVDRRIRGLREEGCSIVIALCDWRDEKAAEHSVTQEAMARRCVRAGACLVVGYGPTAQGVDEYEGAPILYSLGLPPEKGKSGRKTAGAVLARVTFDPAGEAIGIGLRVITTGGGGKETSAFWQADENTTQADEETTRKVLEQIWRDSPEAAYRRLKLVQRGE